MNLRLFDIRPTSVGHLPSSETRFEKKNTYHCFLVCISDLHKSLPPGKLAFCESSLFLQYFPKDDLQVLFASKSYSRNGSFLWVVLEKGFSYSQ